MSRDPLSDSAIRANQRLTDAGVVLSTTTALAAEGPDARNWASAAAMAIEGMPVNSRRSYDSAAQYLAAWYRLRFGSDIALPVPLPAIARFIADHLPSRTPDGEFLAPELPADIDQALVAAGCKGKPGPLAPETVSHRLSFLSRTHKAAGLPSPVATLDIQILLRAGRVAAALAGTRSRQARAITRMELQRMLATCDETLAGIRDRALLLFSWATGGRRRSEVASSTYSNLIGVASDAYDYLLLASDTIRAGEPTPGSRKPLRGITARAMTQWLAVSGITSGPLFRRITRSGEVGAPLSNCAVGEIVKRRARMAGLQGRYTAHSLRVGFVTQAQLSGVSTAAGMMMTGHASLTVYNSCNRPEPRHIGQVDLMSELDE